jgi:enoyl-CoA hydratase
MTYTPAEMLDPTAREGSGCSGPPLPPVGGGGGLGGRGGSPQLSIERAGGVARVTLDRPPLNILTPGLIAELGAAFCELARDGGLRVVVLGASGRAFSAGVEVQAMRDLDPTRARELIAALHGTIRAVRELAVPVLARLHGHVLGGALELVLACDLRVAAASCRLGMPEIRVGIPSVIEAALMPGLIGWGRAAELLLTGETIDAVEAERWGLVNRAVPDEALDREVETWVGRLLALPPHALRLQKGLLARWRQVDLESAIALSMDAFAMAYTTDEPRRAMQRFLDRRRPG